MKRIFFLLLILSMISKPAFSRFGGFWGPAPEEKPTVLSYGMVGFGMGAVLGLSGGYLAALENDDWNNLVTGPAYGAIIGTGIGLAVGVVDVSMANPGVGRVILRDIRLGSMLGMGLGLAVGTINAVDSSEWEDLGKGVAWGSLIGAGGGLLFGIYEGPKIARSASLPRINFTFVKGRPYLMTHSRF
ncbi:MAG: hypothetical protein ACOC56_01150 [Atribacterota bacterium]